MNDSELETLIRAIKGTYPKFSITKEQYTEWRKRLAFYDFEDIERSFNQYVISGNKETISLVDLIRGVQTKAQKKPIVGDHFCMFCNKHYKTIEECDACYELDLDIRYIKKMSNKFGINYGAYFRGATRQDIDAGYDAFIKKIVEEQEKNPKLKGYELEGLIMYYDNVLKGEK